MELCRHHNCNQEQQAKKKKKKEMLQGKDEGAYQFNSQLWTFCVSSVCNAVPVAGIPLAEKHTRYAQNQKNKILLMLRKKGAVVPDEPLDPPQSSQRGTY